MTRDGKYLITASEDKSLKQWHIKTKLLYKNWGQIHDFWIDSICVSDDSKWLFTADRVGGLKQWNFKRGKLVKDFGEVHNGRILAMGLH